jgi:CRISPR/Cas system-associated exonuclease Cas4 (RecB family)
MQYGIKFHAAMDKYFDGTLDLSTLEDPVLTWVQWTIQLEKRRAKRPGYYPPVAREIHLKAPDLLLEGHVDRIDRTVEGHEILDYKTGRSFYKDAVQLQLAFYAILWEHITGTNVSKLVMLNPRRKQIEVWDFEESLIKRVAYKVAKIRHAIETDTFPAKCTVAKWLVCGLCDIEEVI